ncbi:MAG: cell division topological specificity factor MinE [Coxiellaceae bacterium]|mgnify:FL=1|nr:cell division topological specificity factor MinE [Coxiellaceae bacterium]|tara:strand:- start:13900 stop:14157 length:258 start_codon:yes stop_codon:yes gene_type:complete
MRVLKALGLHKSTAQTAKDRLHIIIAQQRSEGNSPDYLPQLRQEIMQVIAKHTQVDLDNIHVDLQTKDNNAVLELNVMFPEQVTP